MFNFCFEFAMFTSYFNVLCKGLGMETFSIVGTAL